MKIVLQLRLVLLLQYVFSNYLFHNLDETHPVDFPLNDAGVDLRLISTKLWVVKKELRSKIISQKPVETRFINAFLVKD